MNFNITIRCASLKNIVTLLAWSASHCSLFFHLRASPESSAGRGEPLRPTALHPVIFDFFYLVIFAKHSITIRCASLKNIVALLAWSASHCSLFFHLRASPESSAGRGEPLRPTALHPDIFDFLLCYSCETQHNNPLFARKCIEFRLNA